MAKPQRKPKTQARHIDMPRSDYQPAVDIPGASLKIHPRRVFQANKVQTRVTYG